MSPRSNEKYDWAFAFHGDGALYSVRANTYGEAMDKVREMKPGDLIPKMVSQSKVLIGKIIYEHATTEQQVDTDEENYLTSGWSGRDGGRDDS